MDNIFAKPSTAADRYRWPIFSIDFEASGLGNDTYPIEAGIAVWQSIEDPIQSWSSLICESDEWSQNGRWAVESEPIHNIPRAELASGLSPRETLHALNRIVGVGGIAFCDGGKHDFYWLRRLEKAAGMAATFALGDWMMLYTALGLEGFDRSYSWAAKQTVAHRAAPDAAANLCALAIGLGSERPRLEPEKSLSLIV